MRMKQHKRANRGAVVLLLLCIGIQFVCMAQDKKEPVSGEEAEIRALEDRFVAALTQEISMQ